MAKGWATVTRMGAVGDNLMAASVCRPLKRMGYMVEMLTATPNHVVFQHNPHIDKVSVVDADKDMPNDASEAGAIEWQLWFEKRSYQSEVFIRLAHSCEMRHCVQPSATWFWWPPEVRRKLLAGNYMEAVHDIAQVPYDFGPLFYPSEAEREHAQATRARYKGPVIGWVLTGSRVDRRYPQSSLAIARLIRELDATVVITCAPHPTYYEFAKEIAKLVVKQNGNDQGLVIATSPNETLSWSLRRSLTMLQQCDVVIGPDTGPMWAVAFEQVPKVLLLSNMPPESVAKHWLNTAVLHADPMRVACWPCHRLHNDKSTCVPNADDTGAACISDISVEMVVQTTRMHLGDGARKWRDYMSSKEHSTANTELLTPANA